MSMRGPLPPTYFLLYAIVELLLHFIVPIKKFIPFPYDLIGVPFIVIGLWLNIWADQTFKKLETTVKPYEKPSAFISYGPFRISRHPMYLGMFLALLGEAIILGSVIAFLIPLAWITTIEAIFIPTEERSMQDIFGTDYHDYRKKVRRWL